MDRPLVTVAAAEAAAAVELERVRLPCSLFLVTVGSFIQCATFNKLVLIIEHYSCIL